MTQPSTIEAPAKPAPEVHKQDTKKLWTKFHERFPEHIQLHDVVAVNFKPHPFMIGPRHVAHAADHCGGMLGEETCKLIPCAHTGCSASYEDHVHDTVGVLKLTRNVLHSELKALVPLLKEIEDVGMDGIILLDTPEKFRVTEG